MCLLRDLYGPGVERLRLEHQTFLTPSKKKIDINTIASNYHIEVRGLSYLQLFKVYINLFYSSPILFLSMPLSVFLLLKF